MEQTKKTERIEPTDKPKADSNDSLRRIVAVWESLRDETFSFEHEGHSYIWSVTRAWTLIEQAPRPTDTFCPADQGVTIAHLTERYPSLDWEYAVTTDLSRPLLFVPFAGRAQLIDGWHRLAHAVLEHVPELPAYLLTEAEADDCLMLHLSPGGTASKKEGL